jgi:MoaA/NifB/PqqE/SkfB family radical SAM enzyme
MLDSASRLGFRTTSMLRFFSSIGRVFEADPRRLPQANRELNASEVRNRSIHLRSTPLQINVDLTGVCNVHPPCVFCSGKNVGYNYRPLDVTELDKHHRYLSRCERVNDDSFGEPLSHPQFLQIARQFTSNGQQFTFVTNGLLLTREMADALAEIGPLIGMHVSFNAATAETYYKLTGRSFDLLVQNTRSFIEIYRTRQQAPPQLTLTFIVTAINQAEVPAFLSLARDIGASRVLLTPLHDRPSKPIGHFGYDFVYEREMLPLDELDDVGREAERIGAQLGIDVRLQWEASADVALRTFSEPGVDVACLIPWRFLHVQQHSQKVYACPYHKRPIGDLSTQSLDEIWNGTAARELRTALASGSIPQYCWNYSAACPVIFKARRAGFTDSLATEIIMGENDQLHLLGGWHALEHIPEPAHWTSARASFRIAGRTGTTLALRCSSFKPDLEHDPAHGYVESRSNVVGRFELTGPGYHDLRFPLPERSSMTDGENRELTATIVVENPWIPSETLHSSVFEAVVGSPRVVAGSRDTRQLGIVVHRIWIE